MRPLLWMGLLAAISYGNAGAQFLVWFYYDHCDQPLTTECGGGVAMPDNSALVELFWDQNNNGPDSTDEPAREDWLAPPYAFPINGEMILGCAGTFYPELGFTISTNTPQPSRYWLRICHPDPPTSWITHSFTVVDGLQEIALTFNDWTCFDSSCACLRPPPVEEFEVEDLSCEGYRMHWDPYPALDSVDSLFIYSTGGPSPLAGLPRTATFYETEEIPPEQAVFAIRARRVCPDSSEVYSFEVADIGGWQVQPPDVGFVGASDTIPEYVHITWSVVSTSYNWRIYRDSLAIAEVEGGPNFSPSYNDSTALPGVEYLYHVTAVDPENPVECEESDFDGSDTGIRPITDATGEVTAALPSTATLAQNYPNPFNAFTTIEFGVPLPTPARVDLFDVQGRLVRTLFDDVARGNLRLSADLRDLASGVYVYRLTTATTRLSYKMLLIR